MDELIVFGRKLLDMYALEDDSNVLDVRKNGDDDDNDDVVIG